MSDYDLTSLPARVGDPQLHHLHEEVKSLTRERDNWKARALGLMDIKCCRCPVCRSAMEPSDFADLMRACRNLDAEQGHAEAGRIMGDLLARLGYSEGVEIFRSLTKWYA